jgi:shikimate kinase
MRKMNIFLIGYRGTGKSTVARLLAERLKLAWLDADEVLERRAGKTIAEIFATDGETAFRDWETTVVADLAARENLVVALGGGAILRAENRRAISGRGRTVWLRAGVETLARRIAADAVTAARRPNLTAAGGPAEIEQLLAAREQHYRACAEFAVDTEGKTPEQVAAEIAALVGNG